MRIGCTLPQFREDPGPAIEAAHRAEDVGLAGVFVFDHLWPLSGPNRPVLSAWPLIGALAAETKSITVGTLVARVGVVSNAQLISQLRTCAALADGRFIAGIGAGDRLSFAENEAYGVPAESRQKRVAAVEEVARATTQMGLETWIGGRHQSLVDLSTLLRLPMNLWQADVSTIVAATSVGREVTWGGLVLIGRDPTHVQDLRTQYGTRPGLISGTVAEVALQLGAIAAAGATWAVLSPLNSADVGGAELMAEVAARIKADMAS